MRLFAVFFAGLMTALAATAHAAPPKEIFAFSDAYLRETPSTTTAGYFTVTNNGEEDDRLNGASADWAGSIQLHDVKANADGVMEMKRMDFITIKKGETVTFAPSGRHLMIYDVNEKLTDGQTKTITFHFDKAGAVNATFDVKPITYSKTSDDKKDNKKTDKKADANMGDMDHSTMDHSGH